MSFFEGEMTCRVCGCTDHDCSGCVEKTGEPCHWVAENLCSACVPVRALSIRQPWAQMLAQGIKPVENRTWGTAFRGRFWIHASKTFDREGYVWIRTTFPKLDIPMPGGYSMGGIVGMATMIDCVEEMPSPWFAGPFGFVIEQAEKVEFKKLLGQRKFFEAKGIEL